MLAVFGWHVLTTPFHVETFANGKPRVNSYLLSIIEAKEAGK